MILQEKSVNGFSMGSDSVSENIDEWFQIKNNARAYLEEKPSNKTGSSGLRNCFEIDFVTIKSLFDQLIQIKNTQWPLKWFYNLFDSLEVV